ncbi:hypothetical protein [Catenuloplanes japonicus]|uniref:hypothetical protein n=1 Tax=Catenuloplanes japonicus TaxID=33876 RepID=UPI000526ED8A|nr:hypothetical protein [Catenuloplanes japonicus]
MILWVEIAPCGDRCLGWVMRAGLVAATTLGSADYGRTGPRVVRSASGARREICPQEEIGAYL